VRQRSETGKGVGRWVLWLSAAISFAMALGGYAIMVYFVLKQ
jgi:hypothetical protein